MGHNDVIFLGQEKLILGHHKINHGTKPGCFLGYWKVIFVYSGRWSCGFWDDNNIFHKMKNDLTTRQDDIWCPINIILLCTSDVPIPCTGHHLTKLVIPCCPCPQDIAQLDQPAQFNVLENVVHALVHPWSALPAGPAVDPTRSSPSCQQRWRMAHFAYATLR
jgi:hypothetical protein